MASSRSRGQVLVVASVLDIQGPGLGGELDIQSRHNSVAGESPVQPDLDSFTITDEEKKHRHWRGLSVILIVSES